MLRHTLITFFFLGECFLSIHFLYSMVDVNDGGGVVNKNTTCWETMAKKKLNLRARLDIWPDT